MTELEKVKEELEELKKKLDKWQEIVMDNNIVLDDIMGSLCHQCSNDAYEIMREFDEESFEALKKQLLE